MEKRSVFSEVGNERLNIIFTSLSLFNALET
jgi:hypothetical protein